MKKNKFLYRLHEYRITHLLVLFLLLAVLHFATRKTSYESQETTTNNQTAKQTSPNASSYLENLDETDKKNYAEYYADDYIDKKLTETNFQASSHDEFPTQLIDSKTYLVSRDLITYTVSGDKKINNVYVKIHLLNSVNFKEKGSWKVIEYSFK